VYCIIGKYKIYIIAPIIVFIGDVPKITAIYDWIKSVKVSFIRGIRFDLVDLALLYISLWEKLCHRQRRQSHCCSRKQAEALRMI
jgi:hypothetical protein